jgi:hypothetical protein
LVAFMLEGSVPANATWLSEQWCWIRQSVTDLPMKT